MYGCNEVKAEVYDFTILFLCVFCFDDAALSNVFWEQFDNWNGIGLLRREKIYILEDVQM